MGSKYLATISFTLAELSGFAGYELVNCLIFHEVTPKGLHYTAAVRTTSSAVIFGGA